MTSNQDSRTFFLPPQARGGRRRKVCTHGPPRLWPSLLSFVVVRIHDQTMRDDELFGLAAGAPTDCQWLPGCLLCGRDRPWRRGCVHQRVDTVRGVVCLVRSRRPAIPSCHCSHASLSMPSPWPPGTPASRQKTRSTFFSPVSTTTFRRRRLVRDVSSSHVNHSLFCCMCLWMRDPMKVAVHADVRAYVRACYAFGRAFDRMNWSTACMGRPFRVSAHWLSWSGWLGSDVLLGCWSVTTTTTDGFGNDGLLDIRLVTSRKLTSNLSYVPAGNGRSPFVPLGVNTCGTCVVCS